MSETKLKPCPFCGGDEIEAGTVGYAYCINCDAEGPHTQTKADAIEAWNKRDGQSLNDQIWCLIEIRKLVGDPEAKLMQSEVIDRVRELADHFREATKKGNRREAAKGEER